MHVLHRPQLPRAIAVTLIAAALALVLTLALAAGVRDLGSTHGAVSATSVAPTLTSAGHRPAWVSSPFSPLLSAPVAAPWITARP
jgi:hypothetical protein